MNKVQLHANASLYAITYFYDHIFESRWLCPKTSTANLSVYFKTQAYIIKLCALFSIQYKKLNALV